MLSECSWSGIIKVESTNSPKYDKIIKKEKGEKNDLR